MDELFENPGLCHIGSKIYNYLNLQTKLTCRLVRKSWNDMFEKQASKCDLQKVVNWSKFLSELKWKEFLKELKTRIPTSVLKLLLRLINSSGEEFKYRTPLLAFAIIGNSKIVDVILNMNTITISNNEYIEALNSAMKYGHVNVAKCLKTFRNYEVIFKTVQYGHLEILEVLMDDVTDFTDLVDWKTIRAAAWTNRIEMIKCFEEKLPRDWFEEFLAKKDYVYGTIFHNLATKGHLEMLKYLCQTSSEFPKSSSEKQTWSYTNSLCSSPWTFRNSEILGIVHFKS